MAPSRFSLWCCIPALVSALGTLVSGLLPCVGLASAAAQNNNTLPAFQRVPCNFAQPAFYPRDLKRECGFLTVPEVRGNVNSRTFRLAVVVYHPPEPDGSTPLLLLHGGPGGTGGTRFNWGEMALPFARHRDVVTFDMRGVAQSEPKLCPDFEAQASPAFLRPTRAEWERDHRAVVRACVASLDAQKFDRNAYGSDVNAQDALDLRRALGYARWDIYGVSYGGFVAQELMRLDPLGTRAAVLISTGVPGGDYAVSFTLASQHHLERIFANCAAQSACARAFPKLEQDFYALHQEFSANPVEVAVADTQSAQTVVLDGDRFLFQMHRQMRQPDAISRLPLLINELRRGDRNAAIRRLFGSGRIASGDAIGSLIGCNDYGGRYQSYLVALKAQMRPPFQAIADDVREACDLWLPNPTHQLNSSRIQSDIPTLILDGEYDPSRDIEPTQKAIAAHLSHAYAYTLPRETHANAPTGCHGQIIENFLANPSRAPDTSCIARMPGLQFKTKSFAPTVTIVISNTANGQKGLAGTWEAALPIGPDYTMQLEYNGSSVQGTVLEGLLPLYDGRIDESMVSFKTKVGTRTITFTGTLQGDTLAFTRDVEIGTSGPGGGLLGTIGLRRFTARRVQFLPRFEHTECFQQTRSWSQQAGVECGWLIVPEDRARPNGPTVRLAVVLRRAQEKSGAPPVVYLHGGPGGAGGIVPQGPGPFNSALSRGRDYIVYDQRGAGLSEPKLCTELTADTILLRGDTARTKQEGWNAIAHACIASMKRQGREPSAYSTEANALDLIDLRRALGYARWDLRGVSYGARVAFEAMRRDAHGIRAVVLESAVIPGGAFGVESPLSVQHSLEHLFAVCAAQPACQEAAPGVAEDFYTLYDSLSARPLSVQLDRGRTTTTVRIDGEQFLRAIRCDLSNTRHVPRLPLLIHRLRRGDAQAATLVAQACGTGGNFNAPLNLVNCYDTWSPHRDARADSAAAQAKPMFRVFEGTAPECNIWQQRFANPATLAPVSSDLPTLLLTGEFDERTPADHSRRAAAALTHAYQFEVPGESHGNPATGCHLNIVVQFLGNPARKPDATCLGEMHVAFATQSLDITNVTFVVTATAANNRFAGRWEAEFPNAPRPAVLSLDIKNEAITGTLSPQQLPLEGRARGDTISFTLKSPNGARSITFTGVLRGDEIDFTRAIQDSTGASGGGAGILGSSGPRSFSARRSL